MSRARDDAPTSFVLELARALHHHGYPTHQLEAALGDVSKRLEIRAEFFAMPTGLFAAFGDDSSRRTHLLRLEPGTVDLGRLADIDVVRRAVVAGELAPQAASHRIRAIETAPPRYRPLVWALALPVASASAAVFLGGGWAEIAAAAAAGASVAVLALLNRRLAIPGRLFEALAALVAAALAVVWAGKVQLISTSIVTIAGLISLVPGLALTIAVTELATEHVVAGTSRLTGAIATLMAIGFGVALGRHLAMLAVGEPTAVLAPAMLAGWVEVLALLAAAIAYTVLLQADRRETPWIAVAGVVGVEGTRLGVSLLGPELGAFLGALAVGVGSNALARWRRRPAATTLVPGILLLVPGSVGVRSINAFLARETVSGLAIGFQMALVAVALAMGLLLANLLVAPDRAAARLVDRRRR